MKNLLGAGRMTARYLAMTPSRPKETKRFIASVINHVSTYGLFPKGLVERPLHEILPGSELQDVFLRHRFDPMALPYGEAYVLGAITRHLNPRSAFEFGTYTGGGTLVLAQHSADHCKIFTLDLPPGHEKQQWPGLQTAPPTTYAARLGEHFRGTCYQSRIVQLYGDSMTFDVSAYSGLVDLVFIDAVHSYEYVRNDTRKALQMLSSSGTIIWDDCSAEELGVVRALDELNSSLPIYRIAGTRLAIHTRMSRDL